MKVRITVDTIRIRLNQTEVRTLGNGNAVQMVTALSDSSHMVSTVRPASVETASARFVGFSLIVEVPRPMLTSWAENDVVTLESRQANGTDVGLTILIEKDFHCLHRNTADDADTFPNPMLR